MSYYDYYGVSRSQGFWYYLIFPLDAWVSHEDDPDYAGFTELKLAELLPMMLFVMPLIVLCAGIFLDLGFFSGLFFYGSESLLLALVSRSYSKIDNFGFVIELTFNFWLSFILMTLGLLLFMLIFGFFLFD